MARTGPFLWAKAVNHHLESDRRTAPGCARCIEGLLMTSIEDAVPIDAALQCVYGAHRSISVGKSSQPPPRIRPQNSTWVEP